MWWRFPYTNFHELNLDWVINTVKTLTENVRNIENKVNDTINNLKQTIADVINEEINEGELTIKYETGLENKKILIAGDSISDTDYKSDIKSWTEYFTEIINGINGASVTNLSKAGRNIIDVANVINGVQPNYYDIVIIFAGINDYFDSTPIGMFTSSKESEFSGACNKLLGALQTNCETADVYIVSPLKTKEMSTPKVSIISYVKRLYSLSIEGGYKFIDAYRCAPILCLNNQNIINKYYDEGYNNRFVHPNSNYGGYLADFIYNKIKNKENDTLGYYTEILTSDKLADQFESSIYDMDANSYIAVGTYGIEINLLGRLLNPSSLKGLQKFWTIPEFIKTPAEYEHLVGWTNSGSPTGLSLSYNDFYIRYSSGVGYVDLTNVNARGLVFQIRSFLPNNLCTDVIIPETYPGN